MLTVATLINTIGNGVYMTAGVLYFTRVVHLPAYQVGLGFSIAGLVSLGAGIPVGHLSDRHSPRAIYAATLLGGALSMAGFYFVRSFARSSQWLASPAPLRRLGQPPVAHHPAPWGSASARIPGLLRSVTLGVALGAVCAGVAVEANTTIAYQLLIVGNCASFAISAAIIRALPSVRSGARPTKARWTALRDYPYIALTLLDSVLAIQLQY